MEMPTATRVTPADRPPNACRSRARFLTWLAVVAAGIAILSGFVYAPVAFAATGDFIISGRGNGQGQGMSQWGMWQGAREGNTYRQILAFYYPGTTLTTVSAVAPAKQTVTVRITTSVDTFSTVQLTAMVTPATLFDSTGAIIQTVAVGYTVTLVYNGSKVQVQGSDTTYSYVDFKPDSPTGRVKVTPSEGLWSGGARQYWGYIRVLPDSSASDVYVHNIVDIDKFAAGVSEISPDWARPSSMSYYAPEAVKAQMVAARTYIAAHTSSVPYDDSRDMTYVGYNMEAFLSVPHAGGGGHGRRGARLRWRADRHALLQQLGRLHDQLLLVRQHRRRLRTRSRGPVESRRPADQSGLRLDRQRFPGDSGR